MLDYKFTVDNKSGIDFTRVIPLVGTKEDLKLGKIIVQNGDSSRRVSEKCEVRLNIHKYVCDKESGLFTLFNKNKAKAIEGKKIEKMLKEEEVIRRVLLGMNDGEIVWILVDRDYDTQQREIAKQELKVSDLEAHEQLFYYRIFIEAVFFDQPPEPKLIRDFAKYIETYSNEVRYFYKKEQFKTSDSWFNSIYNKYFKMGNALKKQLTPEYEKLLLPLFKSLFLNKTLILKNSPKPDKIKDFQDTITYVTEYRKLYPEKDDKYFKILCREANSYLELRNLEKFREVINELSEINNDHPEIAGLMKEYEMIKPKSKQKNIISGFGKLGLSADEVKLTWDKPRRDIDLSVGFFPGILNN
jgi:hypothetical protein